MRAGNAGDADSYRHLLLQLTPVLRAVARRGLARAEMPAAIHVTPEALDGGPISRLRDGDIIALDADVGTLTVELSPEALQSRPIAACDLEAHAHGYGANCSRCSAPM
jgi:dihydroxyacid dehydratase/phosphogluconate dehydratase